MPSNEEIRLADGQLDFSYGVDSSRVTTIASQVIPNGLPRNALSWANNVTTRGGGVGQRTGYVPVATLHDPLGLYQGGIMYEQTNGLPYLMFAVSGRLFNCRLDTDNSVNDITGSAVMPAAEPLFHFAQGEEFVVVQAGDYTTLPAFFGDAGAVFRQSLGLGGTTKELPAAGPMVYYQGRLWYGLFRSYTAGDIVGGPSGSGTYQLRDSILKVTENPLAIGGDGFAVPTQAGNIRALQYSANLDAALGQGTLFIFTRKQVYAMDVPITRADWIDSSATNAPLQRVVQRTNGGVSDRSVVPVNGDLFYQSLEPGIRSLFTALRYFNQWGNKPISNNLQRALAFNDRSLMMFSTGIEFDNRMYQAILPQQRLQGVIHEGIAVMDFEPVASFQEKAAPCWEGMHEGMDVLQLFTGDFGGRERAFAVIVSRVDQSIQLWEITNSERTDNVDHLVDWYVEFPAYTWQREFELKRLDGGEIWIDKLFGDVFGQVFYRVDANPCWQLWHGFKLCSARNCCEDVNSPITYPLEMDRESGKFPIMLPIPPKAACSNADSRPMNIGHQFQVKIAVKGWCRIRGVIVYAVPVLKTPFGGLTSLPSPMKATAF